jgi:hypothetical protein
MVKHKIDKAKQHIASDMHVCVYERRKIVVLPFLSAELVLLLARSIT